MKSVEEIKEFLRIAPEGADKDFMKLWNKSIISEMLDDNLITEDMFNKLMDWVEESRK